MGTIRGRVADRNVYWYGYCAGERNARTVRVRVPEVGTSDSTSTVPEPVRVLYWVELPKWGLKGICVAHYL